MSTAEDTQATFVRVAGELATSRTPRSHFWLVDDDVFGCNEHVCALSVMGARRDGIDTQTRVVIVFRYRERSTGLALALSR